MQVLFAKIYTLIGLRGHHLPTKEQDAFHIQFIKRNYGSRKLAEIYFAFELAVLGKLDLEDVKCYDQFTMEYFGRIMQSYRRYFNQNVPITQLEAKETTLIENVIQPIEKDKEVKEWRLNALQSIYSFPLYIYDYLTDLNKISLTSAEKFNYLEKAYKYQISLYEKEMNYKDMKLLKNNYAHSGIKGITGEYCNLLRNLAKRLIVKDYYESQENGCQPQNDNEPMP